MAISDNLDGLKKFVSDFAQTAATLTKKAASATRTNVSLLTEQEKLKKAYLELGKLYYRDFISGDEPDDAEYLPLCRMITETEENIEAMRGKLETLKSGLFGGETADAETEPADAAPSDPAAELENLHRELDELTEELRRLDQAPTAPAAPAAPAEPPIFEVVDDVPPEDPAGGDPTDGAPA